MRMGLGTGMRFAYKTSINPLVPKACRSPKPNTCHNGSLKARHVNEVISLR